MGDDERHRERDDNTRQPRAPEGHTKRIDHVRRGDPEHDHAHPLRALPITTHPSRRHQTEHRRDHRRQDEHEGNHPPALHGERRGYGETRDDERDGENLSAIRRLRSHTMVHLTSLARVGTRRSTLELRGRLTIARLSRGTAADSTAVVQMWRPKCWALEEQLEDTTEDCGYG